MPNTEDKIRAKAHELWLADGQPEGKADEHWQAAEALVLAAKPKAPRKPSVAAAKKEPAVKKAATAKKVAAPNKDVAPKKAAAPKKPDLKVVSDKDAVA